MTLRQSIGPLALAAFLTLVGCTDTDVLPSEVVAPVPEALSPSVVGPEADNALKPADTPEFLPEDFKSLL